MKFLKASNEDGFTLIEMLIVLLIISVLILITIPNVTRHFESINEKGCSALVQMVQGQVEAYKIDFKTTPTIQDLVDNEYLNDDKTSCPNGDEIVIQSDGSVSVK
ncbi:competence type IV pilus major pilin ComGC [Lysinibacillus telephonicus]|uniref:ComG operon protein 3 n=1 Tax=Lysinibacillus telephonicus TaxID=1714840 RepID=A0A3S0JJK8_9BACI|nr:competence type IV pilus major pilin ComGC [Lysinibacillus telephonicus]RTQ89529.1 prepilin-type N-terminal cleavage/methylation domain-containing protein [Lysinibacillus telephonicus]